jgi:SOS-response transcriptional repressor LexA
MHQIDASAICIKTCLSAQTMGKGDMGAMNERLRYARERAGFGSASEAAAAMGIATSTYVQHENGIRGFPHDRAARYATFFRVTPEWLLYGTSEGGPFLTLGPQLFVKGEVAAGVWREAWQYDPDEWAAFTGRADVRTPTQFRFGLRVVGESMNEIYPPETIIECVAYDGSEPLKNGKRVVVQRQRDDGTFETTVKEYHRDSNGIEWFVPRSTHPAFQVPIRAALPDPGIVRVEVIGVVVASVRPE